MDTVIYLGNRAAVGVIDAPGKWVTIVKPAEGLTFGELVHDLTHPEGIWAAHSNAEQPTWVACTDSGLGARLAAFYGCEYREVEE